jgi:hypothetical protein
VRQAALDPQSTELLGKTETTNVRADQDVLPRPALQQRTQSDRTSEM